MNPAPRLRTLALIPLLLGVWLGVLAGCGGGSAGVPEEEVRRLVKELAQALVAKDRATVAVLVDNFTALGGASPTYAKKWETEEGRKEIVEQHYRGLKIMMNDAGILTDADVERLMSNITVHPGGQLSPSITFEIAADPAKKTAAEVVTLTVARRGDGKVRLTGYGRTLKTR